MRNPLFKLSVILFVLGLVQCVVSMSPLGAHIWSILGPDATVGVMRTILRVHRLWWGGSLVLMTFSIIRRESVPVYLRILLAIAILASLVCWEFLLLLMDNL